MTVAKVLGGDDSTLDLEYVAGFSDANSEVCRGQSGSPVILAKMQNNRVVPDFKYGYPVVVA